MRFGIIAVLGVALAGIGAVGCEREIAREEKVDVDDGVVERDTTVVKEQADGTVVQEKTETKQPVGVDD